MNCFFSYLSKKISMAESAALGCVAWNKDEGYLCCGTEGGTVKVIKMDMSPEGKTKASTHTLTGHAEGGSKVVACAWNERHKKLTTCDASGHIIVWVRHKSQWTEEMTNNRQKSHVTDMRWAHDGSRIAIAYEDGAVIVGKVDGARVWGKELELALDKLCWSPSGQNLLFTTRTGEVMIYDADGNLVSELMLQCRAEKGKSNVASLDWYSGPVPASDGSRKVLAIALVNGMMQLMSSQLDKNPSIVDTMAHVSHIAWSPNGELLVVAGTATAGDVNQDVCVLRFYTHSGNFLHEQRVPRVSILEGVSWEGSGVRLALATDKLLYVVSIRPSYTAAYCARSLVYTFNAPDTHEQRVMFWDLQTGQTRPKATQPVSVLVAHGLYCLLATRGPYQGKYSMIICNSIGSPVDSRYLHFEPTMAAMTATHAVLCNADVVYVWNFCTPQGRLTALENPFAVDSAHMYEHIFHIEEGGPSYTGPVESYIIPDTINAMPITATCACADFVLLAQRDGAAATIVRKFSLPELQQLDILRLQGLVRRMWLNCDATRLAYLDTQGILHVLALNERDEVAGKTFKELDFKRNEVWDLRWAGSDPSMLALIEKSRLTIVRDLQPEEPVLTHSYLIRFNQLEADLVDMDALMRAPHEPTGSLLTVHQAQSLLDTQELLPSQLDEAFTYVEARPHERLWQLLASESLKQLNFPMAIKAYVLKDDYKSVQFVKQVEKLDDVRKQRAEIAAFFGDYDAAEAIYKEMGRMDLAIHLFMRLGQWERVEPLVKEESQRERPGESSLVQLQQSVGPSLIVDDKLLAHVHGSMGQVYADRHRWKKAAMYFVLAKETDKLAECLFHMNDFETLKELQEHLPDSSNVHKQLAEKYESVGMCEEAVTCYVKADMVQRAIDCCSKLNQWAWAVELAREHGMQADNLLLKRAAQLREQGRKIDEVHLYKKAKEHVKSAQVLVELAKEAMAQRTTPLRIKKLYVLAAFEVERARDESEAQLTKAQGLTTLGGGFAAGRTYTASTRAQATLQGLVTLDAAAVASQESMDRAWRGAEAYHFWLLAHRQLFDGDFRAALRTALNLRRYDDVLPTRDVYALLALVAFCAGYFGQCSKAFMKLESLEEATDAERDEVAELAVKLFVNHPPQDPREINEARAGPDLGGKGDLLQGISSEKDMICVASGRVIKRGEDGNFTEGTIRCTRCRHHMVVSELHMRDPRGQADVSRRCCPLCHERLPDS